jgi:hypothetical protein
MLQQLLRAILPTEIALLSNIAKKYCQCKPALTVVFGQLSFAIGNT